MQKMRLVTINGELGSGKSWVAQQLKARHHAPGVMDITMVYIQKPLELAARILTGDERSSYDDFKKLKHFGLTGRDWMIRLSEDFCKPIDSNIFAKLLVTQMLAKQVRNRQIFILDSNGFPEELLYWRSRPELDVLSVSIDDHKVKPGELYGGGDSRYNLSHMCSVVASNSTDALHFTEAALRRRNWI